MNQFNKLKFLFSSLIIFISFNLFAQKGYNDIVYLKNGSIIHGIVIEMKPQESVKIKMRDKSIFVFKMEEVDRIELGVSKNKSVQYPLSKIDTNPYSGISTGIDFLIGSGIGKYSNQISGVFGAHFLFGYMHNSTLMFGMSAGIGGWNFDQNFINSQMNFDFNLVFRMFPLKKKITPLFIADAGIVTGDNLFLEQGTQWHYAINLGGGIRINESAKRGFTIAICYKNQAIENYYYSSYNYSSGTVYLEAICLQAGISF